VLLLPAAPYCPPPSIREEELPELEALIRSGAVPHAPKGGVENKQGKANILIQVRLLLPSCAHAEKVVSMTRPIT
jgi:hypothetical protein